MRSGVEMVCAWIKSRFGYWGQPGIERLRVETGSKVGLGRGERDQYGMKSKRKGQCKGQLLDFSEVEGRERISQESGAVGIRLAVRW